MKSLISIIIPTYNRAHLLGETLDSILAQTYQHWECIVVDDKSIDASGELMGFYCERDSRIKYYHRPGERRKGANACRNYGFELSKGEYIQWFDSDDLMVPEFLNVKIKTIESNEVDFVISKSANFRDPDSKDIISRNEMYYRFQDFEITNFNYVAQKINWLTYDFLGKREVIEKVRFNEKLPSGQEYNFFCKLTSFTVKTRIIDNYLTLRRKHPDSTQARLQKNKDLRGKEQLLLQFETWKELILLDNKISALYCFHQAIKFTLNKKGEWKYVLGLTRGFLNNAQCLTGFWYFLYQVNFKFFSKGNFFRRKFIKNYNQNVSRLDYNF